MIEFPQKKEITMKKVLFSIVLLSTLLVSGFEAVDAEQLIKMRKEGVPVIDIRTPQEWKERGIIEGAHLAMFFDSRGKAHAKEWLGKLSQLVKNKKEPFIIYCAHANRSKVVGKWLSDKLGYEKVYELKGGIEYGWRDLGKKVTYPAQ
jgi:rhodanese-related sulfurtransferase